MAKQKEDKPKDAKRRSEKYDSKLAINGTFEGVINAAFAKDKKQKEK